jgi:hypothetical protein
MLARAGTYRNANPSAATRVAARHARGRRTGGVGLKFNARTEQTCKFVMKLDDVAGDECTEEMDNKSTGSFAVSSSGSQTFKPEDGWTYTIYWHLK